MFQQKNGLPRGGFTFKQFFVAHDRCAMKVGTDSIALGAWAPIANTTRILDIGTGSGLLALMLAQRTAPDVVIDAVELEPDAVSQAQQNILASPWASRIHIHRADILSWTHQQTQRYQLIVSNPPYYPSGPACGNKARTIARSTATLEHSQLLASAAQLITEDGIFCVILPESCGEVFISIAEKEGWHCRYRTDIAESETRLPHRILLGLSPSPGE